MHFVYLATTLDGLRRVIVKIRGDTYARLPSLACERGTIEREVAALRLLSSIPDLQGRVPNLLYADTLGRHMVATEVGVAGFSLARTIMTRGVMPAGIAQSIGSLLGLIHSATDEFISGAGEEPFFERELRLKLLYQKLPGLDGLVASTRVGPRAFVFGDCSPKNIMLCAEGNVGFVDFDNAHFGSRLLEIGYAAAHILLHGGAVGASLGELHSDFLAGYQCYRPLPEDALFAAAIGGALLYRLKNAVIPYQCGLRAPEKTRWASALVLALSCPQRLSTAGLLRLLRAPTEDSRE